MGRYLSDCLNRRLIFFAGKGGVGKTTLSWATARLCEKHGKKTSVITWNPMFLAAQPMETAETGAIGRSQGIHLELFSTFREYALRILRFETFYDAVFDNHVFKTFVRAAPGVSDIIMAGKIRHLFEHSSDDLLIVDLPSSGHAVSFFESPIGAARIFRFGFVHYEVNKIIALFQSPKTRLDIITLPEEMPVVESLELKTKLDQLAGFHYGFLHLNQALPHFEIPTTIASQNTLLKQCVSTYRYQQERENMAMKDLETINLPRVTVPRLPVPSQTDLVAELANQLETA